MTTHNYTGGAHDSSENSFIKCIHLNESELPKYSFFKLQITEHISK